MNDIGHPLRLLYIEDNQDDVILGLRTLTKNGFQIEATVAHNQAEFEKAVAETQFDIVLSDYYLPDLNGLTALEYLREKQKSPPPFILVTGTGNEAIASQAISMGADDYVVKEYLKQQLPKAVKNALSRVQRDQERQQLLRLLRQSEERYRTLVESALDGIIVVQNNHIVFANPAFLRLVCFSSLQELSAQDYDALITQEETGKSDQRYDRPYHSLKCADNTKKWIEIVTTDFTWQGQQAKLVQVRDVTRRRLAEEQAQRMNETLRQMNASLQASLLRLEQTKNELAKALEFNDRMLQNISHELRTPLTHIKGYTEILLEGIMGEISDEQREALQIINEKADTLNRQINQILTLQTLNAEDFELRPIDLELLVRSVIQDFQPTAQKHNITFQLHIAEDDILYCSGDEERLQESLNNIIDNAIKFSPEGGIVTVQLRSVESDFLWLTISDQGIGVPTDQLERIFDRFYQVDSSMSRRFRGFGVGLALAKQIIEGHGGRIWAESTNIPGEGTAIQIMLPALKEVR